MLVTKASSAIPYKRTPPSWLKMKPEDRGWGIRGAWGFFEKLDEVNSFNSELLCFMEGTALGTLQMVSVHFWGTSAPGCHGSHLQARQEGVRHLAVEGHPSSKGWSYSSVACFPSPPFRPASQVWYDNWRFRLICFDKNGMVWWYVGDIHWPRLPGWLLPRSVWP